MKRTLITHIILMVSVFSFLGLTANEGEKKETLYPNSVNSHSGDLYEATNPADSFTDTLNFMGHWYNEDKREDFIREWIQDYQKDNPEVYINLKFSNEILGKKTKFETAWYIYEMILYNTYAWDIVWMDDNIFQLVSENLSDINWGREYLVDFSEYKKFIESHKPEIFEDSTYKNLTGGQFIGPMIEGYYVLLWYNKQLADKMGLNIKAHGMTYEDFLNYVKEIYSYNKEHNTSYAALYESYDWRTTGQYLFQQLFNSAVNNEKNGTPQKSEEEIKNIALLKTLQAFEELSKYNPLISSYDKNQWFNTRDYMLKDSCVFYLGGSWMYSHFRSLDSINMKNIAAAELPVFYPTDSYLGGYIPSFAVMNNSPHRDRAVDFLLYVCQPKYADKWIQYTQTPTGLKGSTDSTSDRIDETENINEYLERTYKSNINFSAYTKYIFGEKQNITQTTFYEILIDILTGKTTAQKAYDDFKAINEY
ncbi:MAG: extracellular solute-binding protein [Bacteroidales bacterium]